MIMIHTWKCQTGVAESACARVTKKILFNEWYHEIRHRQLLGRLLLKCRTCILTKIPRNHQKEMPIYSL